MTGLLYELEQHRLRAHGPGTLKTARALCDELLSLNLLPAATTRELETFREDVATAAEDEGIGEIECGK